jgi:hypothetical protein
MRFRPRTEREGDLTRAWGAAAGVRGAVGEEQLMQAHLGSDVVVVPFCNDIF